MLTVEYNSENKDVGIIVDQKGAKFLIELLSELAEKGANDHIHLYSGPAIIDGRPQHPDFHALSQARQSTDPRFCVANSVTVVFKA